MVFLNILVQLFETRCTLVINLRIPQHCRHAVGF